MPNEIIKKKFEEIEDVPNHANPNKLKPLCNELLDCITDYSNSTTDTEIKTTCNIAFKGVSHTLEQEVFFATSAFKNKKADYQKTLMDAISKIRLDISTFLV